MTKSDIVAIIDEEIRRMDITTEFNFWFREGAVCALQKLKKRIESDNAQT